jgi:hypothetical protein
MLGKTKKDKREAERRVFQDQEPTTSTKIGIVMKKQKKNNTSWER